MRFIVFLLSMALAMTMPIKSNAQSSGQTDNINPQATNLTDANGNKYGFWTEKEADITWKGEYIANEKVRNWVGFYPNNYIAKLVSYNKGWKDGILLQFDRKGKVTLIENYKNDELHGLSIYYGTYSETPLTETEYAFGKKNGLFRQYYDNGKIQEETYFKQDLKDGLSRWNSKTGKKIAEYNYLMGNFDGIQKTFYENDTVQTLNTYQNNQLSGESKEYYRNGKVKISGKYVNGLKEGPWVEFDELGKVTRTTKFKGGQEVKK